MSADEREARARFVVSSPGCRQIQWRLTAAAAAAVVAAPAAVVAAAAAAATAAAAAAAAAHRCLSSTETSLHGDGSLPAPRRHPGEGLLPVQPSKRDSVCESVLGVCPWEPKPLH